MRREYQEIYDENTRERLARQRAKVEELRALHACLFRRPARSPYMVAVQMCAVRHLIINGEIKERHL